MKFLHISDVHLGCTRYQLPESPRDFFDAWIDVLRKYAIGENVDFVIMCGDFFHKRNVPPETMNYAVAGLNLLKEAGIPVVAIEGNHDQKHYGQRIQLAAKPRELEPALSARTDKRRRQHHL